MVHVGLGRSRSRGVVRVRETRKRGYRYTTQGEISLNLAELESRLEKMEDSTRQTGVSLRAKRKTKKPIRLDTPPSSDEESDDSSDDESSDVTVDRVPRQK